MRTHISVPPHFTLALLLGGLLFGGCDCSAPTMPGGNGDSGHDDDAGPLGGGDGGMVDGELCGDGLDNDGDGNVDEGCSCLPGDVQRCYRGAHEHAGVGACHWGVQDCAAGLEFGMWDVCMGDGSPSDEACDGIDNDCDGEVDEGCECLEGEERRCYGGPAGTDGVGLCRAGVERCEILPEGGSRWSGTCAGETRPADEVCDGSEDEDCDGLVDEGCTCVPGETRGCYGGPAGTRDVGLCMSGTQTCAVAADGTSSWGVCEGAVFPRAESCTGGLDEDCDGLTDCADPDCDAHPACCTPFNETVPVIPPDAEILFVVDRSGSMDWPAEGTTRTRWEELMTAMGAVLPSIADLPLGMLTFPLLTGDAERGNCMVAASPEIPIALGTGATISARLIAADPRAGDTPTPAAIQTVRNYLLANPSTHPRFVVLATDGLPEPNCGATVPATVSAIQALRTDLGVETFVLGFVGPNRVAGAWDYSGIPALRDGLNQMAVAGGRPRAGALRYYEAVDGPAFERSLRAILAAATDCELSLAREPMRPTRVQVRQNGALVPAASYTIVGRRLEFTGAACDAIRAGTVTTVTVSDSCGG
ncbi:MAG: VWA domain-containing protein [Myxococcales bacterium]|nr:VWA domain-containing protein [Myxococcales bacterium]